MGDQAGGLLSPYLRRRRVAAASPHLRAGSVLDFGCGVGELARLVETARYLGVDRDAESLKAARAHHPAHVFVDADTFQQHHAGRRFDVIVALALIEHLPEPENWLGQMAAHLNPSGRLVLTTPHPRLRWAHEFGARLGLFSREAADEHETLLDDTAMRRLAQSVHLNVLAYEPFLFHCNQLFLLGHSRA